MCVRLHNYKLTTMSTEAQQHSEEHCQAENAQWISVKGAPRTISWWIFKEKVGTFVPGEKPTKDTCSCSVLMDLGTWSHSSLTFIELMDSAPSNILK